MNNNVGKQILELMNEKKELEGQKIINMINQLKLSQYILNKNYDELIKGINQFENDMTLLNLENRPILNELFKELSRLNHNYLASAFSLIHNSSVFKKHLKNPIFTSEYDEKLKKINKNPCKVFVNDLRNLFQKYKTPFVTGDLIIKYYNGKYSRDDSKKFIIINKKELLSWGNFDSGTKQYLKKFNDKIDLKIVYNEYQKIIKDFYNWIYNRLNELYSNELKEVQAIDDEIKRLTNSSSFIILKEEKI